MRQRTPIQDGLSSDEDPKVANSCCDVVRARGAVLRTDDHGTVRGVGALRILAIHLLATLGKLLRPSGVGAVAAEPLVLKPLRVANYCSSRYQAASESRAVPRGWRLVRRRPQWEALHVRRRIRLIHIIESGSNVCRTSAPGKRGC